MNAKIYNLEPVTQIFAAVDNMADAIVFAVPSNSNESGSWDNLQAQLHGTTATLFPLLEGGSGPTSVTLLVLGTSEFNFAIDNVCSPGCLSQPLPTALPLFATGLGALGLLGWRRKRAVQSV
jgi:hypothetical protein